jgi:7-cyano-7-deazaguanine synthase in queuosine biosynthesis
MINIPYNKEWKNVAISVSGGADSALLAYLVCCQAKGHNVTIHFISHKRMWKTRPWQSHDSLNVYGWFLKKFPNIKFFRHTNFIAPDIEYGNTGPNLTDEYGKKVSGDNIQQRSFAEYICSSENIDAYYNGVTRNPRLAAFNGMRERDIDPSEDNKHLERMTHMEVEVLHPFRFIDKSEIVKTYKELDIMDLFEITRSCEGEFEGIDYTTYTLGQYVPVCGNCFWCKEREWAIEQSK